MLDNTFLFALTLFSALGSGLVAGILFIFSNTVMNALSKLPPEQGIAAMQSINRVIQNPLFLLAFMGTGLTSLILAVFSIMQWGQAEAIYLLGGSVLYFFGTIVVTITRNVPMNNELDKVQPNSEEGKAVWNNYRVRWTNWNHVRVVTGIIGTLLFILAFW